MRAVKRIAISNSGAPRAGFRFGLALAAIALSSALFADDVIRVPEGEARKAAVSRVEPAYPPMARQLRITGRVQLDAFVDPEGSVEKVSPVSGNPILTAAAGDALKKWKFTPFTANGKPSRAVAGFAFEFK